MRFEEAKNKLLKKLNQGHIKYEIVEIRTEPYGWIFFVENLRYLDSCDLLDRLTGSFPTLVTKDGDFIKIYTNEKEFDDALKEIEIEYKLNEKYKEE